MIKFYDYKIQSEKFDNKNCYAFSITVKNKLKKVKNHKTIIKSLKTYFEKGTHQILARSYVLVFKNLAFEFEVKMNIKIKKIEGLEVPYFISYDGFFKIPFKKIEICKFEQNFLK